MYDLIVQQEAFKEYFLEDKENTLKHLPKINNINIFLGSNNSGKSRFIRNLVNLQFKVFEKSKDLDEEIKFYNSKISSINKTIEDKISFYEHQRAHNSFSNAEELKKSKLDFIEFDCLYDYEPIIKNNITKKDRLMISFLVRNINGFDISFNQSTSFYETPKNEFKYFIPTLRTAHSLYRQEESNFIKIEEDIFSETINNIYKIDKKVNLFTGLHLYIEILNARNSDRKTREKFQNFEDFIGDNFFNGKKIDIVANFDKRKNLKGDNLDENITIHIQGESTTKRLHQLGDGIQALIILMYQIFMANDESYIFIDEPELNLHPGMQRLFLEQISSNEYLKNKKLKYFISTHSNHFLDLTIEKENISIYTFTGFIDDKGENKFIIKNVNSGDNTILRELGVNNSSVFMANNSIWVEGVSDRNYIKAFLKSYLNFIDESITLREDIDFVFF